MFGTDVVVAKLQSFAQGELKDLLGSRREGDVAGGGLLARTDDVLDLLTRSVQRDGKTFRMVAFCAGSGARFGECAS